MAMGFGEPSVSTSYTERNVAHDAMRYGVVKVAVWDGAPLFLETKEPARTAVLQAHGAFWYEIVHDPWDIMPQGRWFTSYQFEYDVKHGVYARGTKRGDLLVAERWSKDAKKPKTVLVMGVSLITPAGRHIGWLNKNEASDD
jgi:hypothetical protein